MKDLTTLSVEITEQNYRNLPLISYSMLSSFAQNGFRSIFSQKPIIHSNRKPSINKADYRYGNYSPVHVKEIKQ